MRINMIIYFFSTIVAIKGFACAPTSPVREITDQLEAKGFHGDLKCSSCDDSIFESVKCETRIKISERSQGKYLIRRHSETPTHRMRCAWKLNEDYQVVSLKKSGK